MCLQIYSFLKWSKSTSRIFPIVLSKVDHFDTVLPAFKCIKLWAILAKRFKFSFHKLLLFFWRDEILNFIFVNSPCTNCFSARFCESISSRIKLVWNGGCCDKRFIICWVGISIGCHVSSDETKKKDFEYFYRYADGKLSKYCSGLTKLIYTEFRLYLRLILTRAQI